MFKKTKWYETTCPNLKKGLGKGAMLELAVDHDGDPSEPFWRKRLSEGGIKVVEKPKREKPKKTLETKSEKKPKKEKKTRGKGGKK